MNLRTALSATAVGLATAGLTCTALVTGVSGASAAPAAAPAKAKLKTTYLCSNSIVTDQSIETTFKAKLPKTVKARKTVKPIPFKVHVVANPDLSNVIRLLGIEEISGTSTGATITVGKQEVKIGKVTIPPTAVPASGNVVLDGTGKSKAFKAGKPGTYDVLAPTGFVADLRDQDDETLPGGPLTCSIEEGAPNDLGSVKVVR